MNLGAVHQHFAHQAPRCSGSACPLLVHDHCLLTIALPAACLAPVGVLQSNEQPLDNAKGMRWQFSVPEQPAQVLRMQMSEPQQCLWEAHAGVATSQPGSDILWLPALLQYLQVCRQDALTDSKH